MLILKFTGLSNFLWDLLYGLALKLDSVIYSFIGWLYEIYMLLSSARIFRTETFQIFINRIYIILGVIMLFFLAYTILTNIVNPDKFNNEGSGMGKIITNTVISLVLIAILPTIFNFLYYAQEIILKEDFLGKVILGNYSNADSKLVVTFDEETCQGINEIGEEGNNSSCTKKYESNASEDNSINLAGNSIAVDIFSAFYYPNESEKDESMIDDNNDEDGDENGNSEYIEGNSAFNRVFKYEELENDGMDFDDTNDSDIYVKVASYNPCHTNEEGYIYGTAAKRCAIDIQAFHAEAEKEAADLPLDYKSILQYSKSTGKFDGFKLLSASVNNGKMEYSILLSSLAGAYVCYMLISYCLDMGLRAAKLGFAQLVAPVPILARIIPKQASMFSSWINFTLKSYFEVFLRIIIIFLGIFMITHLPSIAGLWEDSSLAHISIMALKTPLIMDISSASWGTQMMARVAIIIGILMFVKQAPSLIEQALGININAGSLSIREKLKNMAGAGMMSTAIGAATGAIGAGYMAKKNGGKFFANAVKGGRAGAQGKGWQFGKQGQQAFKDTTGSKYNGSFMPWSRNNSIGGRITRALDNNEKNIKEANKERLKAVQEEYEKSSEFKNMVNSRMTDTYQNATATKNAARQTALNEWKNTIQQAENTYNSVESSAKEAVKNAEDKYNQAKKESDDITRRMRNYENSTEYRDYLKYRTDARNKAVENSAKSGRNVDELTKEYMNKFIANASNSTKQYYADLNNQSDKKAAEKAKQAQIELDKVTKDSNNKIAQANQILTNTKQQAKDTLNAAQTNAQKQFDATINTARNTIETAVRKEIIKNPQNKEQRRYSDAANVVGAKTNEQQIIDLLNKMNNK